MGAGRPLFFGIGGAGAQMDMDMGHPGHRSGSAVDVAEGCGVPAPVSQRRFKKEASAPSSSTTWTMCVLAFLGCVSLVRDSVSFATWLQRKRKATPPPSQRAHSARNLRDAPRACGS